MGIITIILVILGALVLFSLLGNILNLIVILLLWAVIGWLAGRVLRGRGYEPLTNILLGLGGGIVGGILFSVLGLPSTGILWTIVSGVVGAIVVVYLGRILLGNRSLLR
jgi:uncharacterized membrane protein YeaQ/YmgE (transglycosylase-associated protein family)